MLQVPDPGREAAAVEEDGADPDPGLQLVQEPPPEGQDAGHAGVRYFVFNFIHTQNPNEVL